MTEYIIVHTSHGYMMDESPAFTHNIADAMVTINYQKAKDLCDRYMACMWKRDNTTTKWEPCYQPSNKFRPEYLGDLIGEMY